MARESRARTSSPAPAAAPLHELTHFLLLLRVQVVEEIGRRCDHFRAARLNAAILSSSNFFARAWSSLAPENNAETRREDRRAATQRRALRLHLFGQYDELLLLCRVKFEFASDALDHLRAEFGSILLGTTPQPWR